MPSSLLTVFVLPLVALLALPKVYRLLNGYSSYEDAQLHEIASLMDSIYTTMADMTFIPHDAIKRGPHYINVSSIPCTLDRSVIRLMEILPYVDSSLVQTPDWLYGSHFADYRRSDHLTIRACDPLEGNPIGWMDYMTPTTIGLTEWGTGGWNHDETFIMTYDTETHTIAPWHPEMDTGRESMEEMFGTTLEELPRSSWDNDYRSRYAAERILEAIQRRYHTLSWNPWMTSRKEGGFGLDPHKITQLLRENGWPKTFNSTQFNTAFIRAKHKPSGLGFAEEAKRILKDLIGKDPTNLSHPHGTLHSHKQHLASQRALLAKATTPDDRLKQEWHVESATWALEHATAERDAAQQTIQRFCPDGTCVEPRDLVLWELRALERTAERAQQRNLTAGCVARLDELREVMPADPERLRLCVEQRVREDTWLRLACEEARAEALERCKVTGGQLLPADDMAGRVRNKVAELERWILRGDVRIEKMEAWREKIPEHAEQTRKVFEEEFERAVQGRAFARRQLERFREEVERGGEKLWEWFDEEEGLF